MIYEGVQANGPLNLNDRLLYERRAGQQPSPAADNTVLVVIDQRTAQRPHWRGAQRLRAAGAPPPDWQQPRPERY